MLASTFHAVPPSLSCPPTACLWHNLLDAIAYTVLRCCAAADCAQSIRAGYRCEDGAGTAGQERQRTGPAGAARVWRHNCRLLQSRGWCSCCIVDTAQTARSVADALARSRRLASVTDPVSQLSSQWGSSLLPPPSPPSCSTTLCLQELLVEGCPVLSHRGLRAVTEASVEQGTPLLAALQVLDLSQSASAKPGFVINLERLQYSAPGLRQLRLNSLCGAYGWSTNPTPSRLPRDAPPPGFCHLRVCQVGEPAGWSHCRAAVPGGPHWAFHARLSCYSLGEGPWGRCACMCVCSGKHFLC